MKFIVFHVEQKILTEGDSELFIVNIDHSCKENPKKDMSSPIPHICHFFYTSKIFGELNLHRKNA